MGNIKRETISSWDLFSKFVETTLTNTILSPISSDGIDFKNVVLESTAKVIGNGRNEYDIEDIELNIENKALQRIFERIFSMWEAGRDKESLFKILYAFPENDESFNHLRREKINILDRDEELIPLNLDQNYADHFLTCLCARAKAVKESKSALDSANRSRYIFIGDIGSGKTTFLNYIFSRNYKYLNTMGVMWVRIDFSKVYHSHKTLQEALKFQLARIFRKYYYKDNDTSLIETLEREFQPLIIAGRIKPEDVKACIDEYIAEYDNERTEPFHPSVQQGIKKYAQHKYAMVFIFDGLDRVYTRDRFEDKIKEIQEYILGSEKTKNVYVFVMRNNSHAKLLNYYLLPHEERELSALRKVAKTFIISPPKLNRIVEQRLELLCRKWDDILLEIKDDIILPETDDEEINTALVQNMMHKYSWITPDTIRAYYDIFLRFIYRGLSLEESDKQINEWQRKDTFTALKNVVGENFRVLLEVLSALHKRFLQTIQMLGMQPIDIINIANMLENNSTPYGSHIDNLKKILKKHYRVIPVLLRKKVQYIHPYEYVRIKSEPDEFELKLKENHMGSAYIFNIFMGANTCNLKGEAYHPLSKIRILQLLKRNSGSYGSPAEIVEKLYNMFGYKKEYLKLDIQELSDMNMIKQTPDENLNYTYEITRVGLNTIEKLIFEYEYVRIILDDVIVPKKLSGNFIRPERRYYRDNVTLWNISHIPRVCRFISLIRAVEEEEKRVFVTRHSEGDYASWEISTKLKDNFIATTFRILRYSDHDKAYDIISKSLGAKSNA